jgi:phenylpropionate dioxygenase-like ring-hydroxylating dioxygenase large terminal subunit
VQCPYHGVQVAGDGTVVRVPGMPGCHLEGKRLARSLPAKEHAGAIFAYLGDERHSQPVELAFPESLTSPDHSHFLAYAEWDCPWRFAVENVLDPSHGAFLHRESHTMSVGADAAEYRIEESEHGFLFEKTNQQGVNFDWVSLERTGIDWLQLSIPYPPTAGPGGAFGIVGTVTPITEVRSAIFFWRTRKVSGWERDSWRFLYKNAIEERHWEVLEQDRTLLERMADDADAFENLYQHDLALARFRRMLRKEARAQAQPDDPATS